MEKISKFKKIINKFYYNLFIERFNKKINYNFPINFSRSDLIDYFAKKNNYKSYLEIGCDQNQLFSKINIMRYLVKSFRIKNLIIKTLIAKKKCK